MVHELLIGVNVINDEMYQAYRDNMTPILENYRGGFRYHFDIEQVRKADTENPINRVFTIYFPDEATKDAFFADEKYNEIKKQYFDASVSVTTIIAIYER